MGNFGFAIIGVTMKHGLVKIMVFGAMATLAVSQNALAPLGQAGETYIAPHPVSIMLDGQINDWRGVPRVTVTTGMQNPTRVEDGSLTFAVAADAAFIYLLAEITDSTIIAGQRGNIWEEDSLEVYFSANRDLERSDYSRGVAQLTIGAISLEKGIQLVKIGRNAADVNAESLAIKTETGYRIEMRIPTRCVAWTLEPKSGLTLGFDVQLNNTKSANKPQEVRLVWSAKPQSLTGKNASNTPSTFARLVFR
jgi:hypothetical protein